MKTAVVTGGTGFLGRYLVRRLCDAGWRVDVLSRRDVLPPGMESAHLLKWDGDPVALCRLFGERRPDVAFHLAVHYRRSHVPADLSAFTQANLHLGMCLLEALRGSGCSRLVMAGTVWQDSGKDGGAVNLYAATKRAFAEIARHYAMVHGLHTTALMLADSYAEGHQRPRFLTALRDAWSAGKRLDASGGEQIIDMVHAEDLAEAFFFAAELPDSGLPFKEYCVPSGESCDLRALVARSATATGNTFDIAWGSRPYAVDEVFRPIFRAPPLPGWRPKVSLDHGLARFFSK